MKQEPALGDRAAKFGVQAGCLASEDLKEGRERSSGFEYTRRRQRVTVYCKLLIRFSTAGGPVSYAFMVVPGTLGQPLKVPQPLG